MKHTVSVLGALLLSTLTTSTAMAQSTGEASVSNLRYILTDLDLNDGIAPSLALTPDAGHSHASYTAAGKSMAMLYQNNDGKSGLSPVSVSYDNSPSPNQFQLTSAIDGLSIPTFSARASAFTSYAGGAVTGRADTESNLRFVLSPNTSITFLLDAEVAANASAGVAPGLTPAAWGAVHAVVYAGWGGWYNDFEQVELRQEATFGVDNSGVRDETLRLDLDNRNTSFKELSMFVSARAQSYSLGGPPPPVPEPETWAMLLAGVGILGAARARRRPTA